MITSVIYVWFMSFHFLNICVFDCIFDDAISAKHVTGVSCDIAAFRLFTYDCSNYFSDMGAVDI